MDEKDRAAQLKKAERNIIFPSLLEQQSKDFVRQTWREPCPYGVYGVKYIDLVPLGAYGFVWG